MVFRNLTRMSLRMVFLVFKLSLAVSRYLTHLENFCHYVFQFVFFFIPLSSLLWRPVSFVLCAQQVTEAVHFPSFFVVGGGGPFWILCSIVSQVHWSFYPWGLISYWSHCDYFFKISDHVFFSSFICFFFCSAIFLF